MDSKIIGWTQKDSDGLGRTRMDSDPGGARPSRAALSALSFPGATRKDSDGLGKTRKDSDPDLQRVGHLRAGAVLPGRVREPAAVDPDGPVALCVCVRACVCVCVCVRARAAFVQQ